MVDFDVQSFADKIKGKVVAKREENLYHDSYFHCTYWDEETQSFIEYEYASTAHAGGIPGGVVDAPDELIAKYHDYMKIVREEERIASKCFRSGELVKIVTGRKMVGEVKVFDKTWVYVVPGTYGKNRTEYAVFKDGTKVNIRHCVLA